MNAQDDQSLFAELALSPLFSYPYSCRFVSVRPTAPVVTRCWARAKSAMKAMTVDPAVRRSARSSPAQIAATSIPGAARIACTTVLRSVPSYHLDFTVADSTAFFFFLLSETPCFLHSSYSPFPFEFQICFAAFENDPECNAETSCGDSGYVPGSFACPPV